MSGEIPRIPSETHMGDLHGRYKWKKVERPHPWRPKEPGEELVGASTAARPCAAASSVSTRS